MKSRERVYIVPTRYGFLYGAMVFILVSLSTIFNNTDLLLASAVLVTFGVVCMHQTHMNIASISIEEIDSQSGFAGEKISWRLKVSNSAQSASFSINVLEDVIDVPAREISLENISFIPVERGYFQLKEVKFSSTYPLGLFYSWKWAELEVNYYVYPQLTSERALLSPFQDRHSELDSRDDFIGHREFLPGDSAHHIDWKVQARKQKLLIKLFESTSTEAAILDWYRVPASDVEQKLSLLARALFECHRAQKPFGLILPEINVPVSTGTPHYERCLQLLATFKGSAHDKAA